MREVRAQIRIRRAFRYGYFAFLALFAVMLVLIGIAVNDSQFDDILGHLTSSTSMLFVALAVGLSVPLFLASWSLFGSAIFGLRAGPQSMLDGIYD